MFSNRHFGFDLGRHTEPPAPTAPPAPDPPADPKPAKSFSQEDVDRIVAERLNRQKAQFGDYDDLKAKAAKFDELDAASKTELEKAQALAAKAVEEREQLVKRMTDMQLQAEIVKAAQLAGAADTDLVFAALDRSALKVGNDGKVEGLTEAITALLEAKPLLKGVVNDGRPTGAIDQGAGGSGKTTDFRSAKSEDVRAEFARMGVRIP